MIPRREENALRRPEMIIIKFPFVYDLHGYQSRQERETGMINAVAIAIR